MPDLVVVDLEDADPSAPTVYDTSAQQVLDDAWNYLYSSIRVERDKLASGVSASAGTLTTTYQRDGIKAGGKVSIDLEDYHVWSASGATVTVEPGQFGSTTAAHSTGAIIDVNAEWTRAEIFREINNELKSLSSPTNGVHRTSTVTLTYNPAVYGYDLTGVTNVDGILTVVAATPGSDMNQHNVMGWRVERNLDTTVFPSGFGLFFDDAWSGRPVIVAYADQYAPLTGLSDNVFAATGLEYSAHDILAMGAAVRCAAPSEIDRNQTGSQASGRRSSEVPAGARLNAIRGVAELRRIRIREEATRLAKRYPTRLVRHS